jgi:hypothetical protein
MIRLLNDTQYNASLLLHSEQPLSPERRKQLKAALQLLPIAAKHMSHSVPELGLVGFSYSRLFYYLLTLLFTSASRYVMKFL